MWRPEDVCVGDRLIVRDAGGDEHDALAAGTLRKAESFKRGQFFPVIDVRFSTKGDTIPWPAEALRPADA